MEPVARYFSPFKFDTTAVATVVDLPAAEQEDVSPEITHRAA
jgi:hypothetical protein